MKLTTPNMANLYKDITSPRGPIGNKFITEIGRTISGIIKNPKSMSFIFQPILMAVQRGNVQCSYGTLVCRIDVHARLLILWKKSPLYGLIWVCTFIDFEKKIPPARLLGSN